MSIQPGAVLNTFAFGNRPENVEVPTIQSRAPSSADWNYPIGKLWVDSTGGQAWILTTITSSAGINTAGWVLVGGISGTVTLAAGTSTVSTPYVTSNSKIVLSRQGIGSTGAAALGILTIGTITANTSFVINAVQAADATANQASDVSVVYWQLIN